AALGVPKHPHDHRSNSFASRRLEPSALDYSSASVALNSAATVLQPHYSLTRPSTRASLGRRLALSAALCRTDLSRRWCLPCTRDLQTGCARHHQF
ncbi:hypothetical protein GN958_ATG21763, partial [Phytophthora infestans]